MEPVNWTEIAILSLTFATALLAFGAAVARWIVRPVYRLARTLETELANGEDPNDREYVGFRSEVAGRFTEIGARLESGSEWMRDHERTPATDAHGRVQPPR